ncbi:Conserved_hypothetical protein [Hexamita inflata]|uniref:Kelch motif family protein n=1 Tax=Hexamita inflata TaxID=28002 RepID=A0AA86RFX2_9EUKA|nr:Conserved hypothetical protein [Hexamita inflata]
METWVTRFPIPAQSKIMNLFSLPHYIYYNTPDNSFLTRISLDTFEQIQMDQLLPITNQYVQVGQKFFVYAFGSLFQIHEHNMEKKNFGLQTTEQLFSIGQNVFVFKGYQAYLLEQNTETALKIECKHPITVVAAVALPSFIQTRTVIFDGQYVYICGYNKQELFVKKIGDFKAKTVYAVSYLSFVFAIIPTGTYVIDTRTYAIEKIEINLPATPYAMCNDFLVCQNFQINVNPLLYLRNQTNALPSHQLKLKECNQWFRQIDISLQDIQNGMIQPCAPCLVLEDSILFADVGNSQTFYKCSSKVEQVLLKEPYQIPFGSQSCQVQNLAYIFTPDQKLFQMCETSLTRLNPQVVPPGRYFASMCRLDDSRFILSGGISAKSNSTLSDCWVYDITQNKFTEQTLISFPRLHSHQMFATKQSVFVLFGCSDHRYKPVPHIYKISFTVQEQACTEMKLTQFGDTPYPRYGFNTVYLRKRLFIFGGSFGAGGDIATELQVFDFKQKKWARYDNVVYPAAYQNSGQYGRFITTQRQRFDFGKISSALEETELQNSMSNQSMSETSSVTFTHRTKSESKFYQSNKIYVTISYSQYQLLCQNYQKMQMAGLMQHSDIKLEEAQASIFYFDEMQSVKLATAGMRNDKKIEIFNKICQIAQVFMGCGIKITKDLIDNSFVEGNLVYVRLGQQSDDYKAELEKLYKQLFLEEKVSYICCITLFEHKILPTLHVNGLSGVLDATHNTESPILFTVPLNNRIVRLSEFFLVNQVDLQQLEWHSFVKLLPSLIANRVIFDIKRKMHPVFYLLLISDDSVKDIQFCQRVFELCSKQYIDVKLVHHYAQQCGIINRQLLYPLISLNSFTNYRAMFRYKSKQDEALLEKYIQLIPQFAVALILRQSDDLDLLVTRGDKLQVEDGKFIVNSFEQYNDQIVSYINGLMK